MYLIISESKATVFQNALVFASNSAEVIVLLCLYEKVNSIPIKSYVFSVIASYVTIFLLLLFMFAVLGDAAQLRNYPLYLLFQMSKLSSFERLDVLHISFWIIAVFVKAVLMIYCASVSVKKFSNRRKCLVGSVGAFVISFIILSFSSNSNTELIISSVSFFIFCVIIPFLTLIFKKKNKGDELVKRF